jgi:hypothetical protein
MALPANGCGAGKQVFGICAALLRSDRSNGPF